MASLSNNIVLYAWKMKNNALILSSEKKVTHSKWHGNLGESRSVSLLYAIKCFR